VYQQNLAFDASALIFSKPIMPHLCKAVRIVITPLVSEESGISDNVSIISLEEDDKKFVYDILRHTANKDCATNYKKGRRVRNAGEAEMLALAKRLGVQLVLHDKLACTWARTYKISYIKLVDLPDQLKSIPVDALIDFYQSLCNQRSSDKACERYSQLIARRSWSS
jgi:hypothetical protein